MFTHASWPDFMQIMHLLLILSSRWLQTFVSWLPVQCLHLIDILHALSVCSYCWQLKHCVIQHPLSKSSHVLMSCSSIKPFSMSALTFSALTVFIIIDLYFFPVWSALFDHVTHCRRSSACSMLFCCSMTFLTAASSVVSIQSFITLCTITEYILQCILALMSMWFIQSVLTDSASLIDMSAVCNMRSPLRRRQRASTFFMSFLSITLLILSRSSSVEVSLVFDLSLSVLMTISLALFPCSTAVMMHALSAHVDCTVICAYVCHELSEFIWSLMTLSILSLMTLSSQRMFMSLSTCVFVMKSSMLLMRHCMMNAETSHISLSVRSWKMKEIAFRSSIIVASWHWWLSGLCSMSDQLSQLHCSADRTLFISMKLLITLLIYECSLQVIYVCCPQFIKSLLHDCFFLTSIDKCHVDMIKVFIYYQQTSSIVCFFLCALLKNAFESVKIKSITASSVY